VEVLSRRASMNPVWPVAVGTPNITAEEVAASPHVFVGTIEEIVEKLEMVRARWGINIINLDEPYGSGRFQEFIPIVGLMAGR